MGSALVLDVTNYSPVRLSSCCHCVTHWSIYMKNCECKLGDPEFGRPAWAKKLRPGLKKTKCEPWSPFCPQLVSLPGREDDEFCPQGSPASRRGRPSRPAAPSVLSRLPGCLSHLPVWTSHLPQPPTHTPRFPGNGSRPLPAPSSSQKAEAGTEAGWSPLAPQPGRRWNATSAHSGVAQPLPG